ncbi:thiol reductant ABC exporter subunit CydC [Devosia sp. SD17-2]|uniref:thiol reductant ABC exporter subunit CydC n=1 Tax=Devosia sp. SD17-2 TaxID=2976459 RepID=UPI0023D89C49|nr:thiol reductant ABC exporter subunit CydC [Devosia sp. SD17-2]WEJ32420.1 thiol reductant ABC exporter subunit CydC [Devosia sp. SD17-2]
MNALEKLAPLFRRRTGAMALALILALITLASGVALLGTSGWFITATALTSAGLAFNLFVPSSLVRAFSFIRILSRYGERLVGHNATLKLLSDLRGWLFAALFPRLPLSDRSIRHGDLVSRLTADVDALDTAFLVAIGPLLGAIFVGIGVTGVLAWLLPGAAIVYGLAVLGAVLVVPALLVIAARSTGRQVVAASAEARISVYDAVAGHTDLTLLGALGTTVERFSSAMSDLRKLRLNMVALTACAGFAVQVLAAIALIGTLWAGVTAHAAGTLDPAVMVALLLAVLGSFEATSAIVRSVGKAVSALAAAERLNALASLPVADVEPSEPKALTSDNAIAFNNVTFGYVPEAPVVSGVSLSVAAGERVAVSGPSGGGKSTLLRLLLRLHRPQSGEITIGGVSIADIDSAQLHGRISLLSQDSPVFIDSVRSNLLIARIDATEDELWQALDAAWLGEFVRALPKGLDTPVGEAGRTLSAGQMRRLCLARTLLSNAPIILLDEPTNALDRATEIAFFETLAEATKGKTVLMVTHAAIPEGTMDRIVTLRDGRLG